MTAEPEFLWYIPNTVEPGHRGDDVADGWGTLELSVRHAKAVEDHGWGGALLGAGWGRPDTFTVATALAARTTTFQPLVAIRPGYWQPAQFAAASATLDQLSRGRLLINIVSGIDNLAAYGDVNSDPARRYDRTREFLRLVRRLWREPDVTFRGEFFQVEGSTVRPGPYRAAEGRHPAALLRRRLTRGRTGVGHRCRRTTVLGRAAGRHRRTGRPAARPQRRTRTGAPAAGVRAADHHRGPADDRGGVAGGRGPGRRDGRPGRRRGRPELEASGRPAAALRPDRARRGAGQLSLHDSRPLRRWRRRRRPGWSAHPTTSRPPCAATPTSGSATSSCPTRPTWTRSPGSVINSCRCSARPSSPEVS